MVSEVEQEPSGAARPGRIHLGQSPSNLNGGGGGGGAIAGSNEVVDRIRSNYYFLIQGHVCLFYFFSLNYW